jgi:2-keto-4-pentenoate hydratase
VTLSGRDIPVPADLESNTGRLLDILRQVAVTLAGFGEKLRAGDVVIAGSTTPPLMLGPGDDAMRWELRPIGAVSVQFAS